MEENKIIDFDSYENKVFEFTMPQLKRTIEPLDRKNEPIGGIIHHCYIDEICERATKLGLNIKIWEMFAADNSDKYLPGIIKPKAMVERYGATAAEAHQLNRIFVNARITNFDDDKFTTNIGIAYHQKGIQVAIGSNIKICHNQMILGTKDLYVATYSDRGSGKKDSPTPWQSLDIIEGYLTNIGDRVYEQRKKLKEMENIVLTTEQICIFIGMLERTRVRKDSKDSRIHEQCIYPLSDTEINRFTERILIKETEGPVTLMDIYNESTNLYKAKGDKFSGGYAMQIPNIHPQNYAMVEMIEKWSTSIEDMQPRKSYIIEAPKTLQIETL